jgi:hypothetical protein
LQKKTLLANGLAMELLDDLLADLTRLKAVQYTGQFRSAIEERVGYLPCKTDTPASMSLGIAKDSAGADSVVHEDGTEFLEAALVSVRGEASREQTDSVMFLGRFEM